MNKEKWGWVGAWATIIGWFACLFGGMCLLSIEGCLPLQIVGGVLAFGAIASFVWFLDVAGQ